MGRNKYHIVLLSDYPGGEPNICLIYSEVSCTLGLGRVCVAGSGGEWAGSGCW